MSMMAVYDNDVRRILSKKPAGGGRMENKEDVRNKKEYRDTRIYANYQ